MKKTLIIMLLAITLVACNKEKQQETALTNTQNDSTEATTQEEIEYVPIRKVHNYFGGEERSWPYWEQRNKEVPAKLDEAFKTYLSKFSDSAKLATHKMWCVWRELNYHLEGYTSWSNKLVDNFMFFENDSLENVVRMNEYIRHITSLDEVIDIYNHDGFYEHYFDSVTQIRLVRYIPSNSDTSHVLIVLDKADDTCFRRLVLIEKTKNGLREMIQSDSILIRRCWSGKVPDMLVDIVVYPDAFTIANAHPGRWNHGSEFTFCKKQAEFVLAYGVGYQVSSKEMYCAEEGILTKMITFFESGINLRDFKYGRLTNITCEFEVEDKEYGSDNLEKFFGIIR